jgi:hypothetical protein
LGTSQSSNGPGAAVAMVPPWVDALPPEPVEQGEGSQTDDSPELSSLPLAPLGRFRAARRNLGSFARTGDSAELRRGLGQYVRQGYGGSGTLTRRLSGTATTAGRLGGVLQSALRPDGTALRDAILSSSPDANVVMDAIVEAVRPTDGTQDAEASRKAVRDALADLLERFPDADLLELNDSQREFVVERFAALDVYNRFCLDMQKAIMGKAPDPSTGLSRLKQVRNFIAQSIAASFRTVREKGAPTTTMNIVNLTRRALTETFKVFEEYLT